MSDFITKDQLRSQITAPDLVGLPPDLVDQILDHAMASFAELGGTSATISGPMLSDILSRLRSLIEIEAEERAADPKSKPQSENTFEDDVDRETGEHDNTSAKAVDLRWLKKIAMHLFDLIEEAMLHHQPSITVGGTTYNIAAVIKSATDAVIAFTGDPVAEREATMLGMIGSTLGYTATAVISFLKYLRDTGSYAYTQLIGGNPTAVAGALYDQKNGTPINPRDMQTENAKRDAFIKDVSEKYKALKPVLDAPKPVSALPNEAQRTQQASSIRALLTPEPKPESTKRPEPEEHPVALVS